MSLEKVSTARRVLFGAGAVLLIWSFLPWNGWDGGGGCSTVAGVKVCTGGSSWSMNAWHGIGIVMGLILIALLAWEAVLLVQVVSPEAIKLPELPVKPILISLGLGALTLLFGVIRVFEYGARKWEIWIALLLMIALAAGLFLRFQDEGGSAAIK
jgi:hypothetical protein